MWPAPSHQSRISLEKKKTPREKQGTNTQHTPNENKRTIKLGERERQRERKEGPNEEGERNKGVSVRERE